MSGGVKLYKHFIDEIAQLGKIKRAWFTTFNFDISFFEKYILTALTGSHYSEVKTPQDYEAISSQLSNDNYFTAADEIEVKVFCDYRVEKPTGRPKQTVIDVYKVDINNIKGINSSLKFTDGVFHPKVILLESYNGEYLLMVGSANLTFGGWAHNRESFFCDKILNTEVAREIGLFFSGITSNYKDLNNHPLLAKLNSGKFGNDSTKWSFVSSFSKTSFLNRIIKKGEEHPLTIWSPYFGGDLTQIVNELQEKGFNSIDIIPSKTESQKIRITESNYQECKKNKDIRFLQDRLPKVAIDSFVHAKVWLTPKALAIGSWNMTRSGMNISTKKNNNIEAGIIIGLTTREYNEIIKENSLSILQSPIHCTKEELEDEKNEFIDDFPIALDLIVDWDKLEIQLGSPRYNHLINSIKSDDVIKLPGIGKLNISRLSTPVDIRHTYKHLLNDRFFEIQSKQGEILYRGYLREIGLVSRPVNGFKSIDDFFKGWVSESPENKTDWHRPVYVIEEEYGDDFSQQTRQILLSEDQNAWFTSFNAFEKMINRIQATSALTKKDRLVELKRIGRVLPGSLSELKTHLESLLSHYRTSKESFKKSPIYLWFLIEKANQIFLLFNEQVEVSSEHIKKIKNLNLKEILSPEQLNENGEVNIQKWMNYVSTKLKL